MARSYSHRLLYLFTIPTLLTLMALAARPVQAQIDHVDLFRDADHTQTGDGNTLSLSGYYLAARLYYTNSGDFTTGTVDPGNGMGPLALTNMPTQNLLIYQTAYFANQAALDAAYPLGDTYMFTAQGGTQGAQTATETDTSTSFYPINGAPYLTGNEYDELQGVNAASAITLQVSPYTIESVAHQYRFFSIYDDTANTFVYDASFLAPGVTTIFLAANTLTAGHDYTYELIDSNRQVDQTGVGGVFLPVLGNEYKTFGNFYASSVPEPAVNALLTGLCLSGLGLWRRRKNVRG
jgi:hypothetical protein